MSNINYSPDAEAIRRTLRSLFRNHGGARRGDYTRIAELFGISRERVRQLANEVKREFMGMSHVKARFGIKQEQEVAS